MLKDYAAAGAHEVLAAAADIIEQRGLAVGVDMLPTGEVDVWSALLIAAGARPAQVARHEDPDRILGTRVLPYLAAVAALEASCDDVVEMNDAGSVERVVGHLRWLAGVLARSCR